jgi:hypothetical protein
MTSLSQIQRSVRDAMFEAGRDGPALRTASQHVLPGAGMTSTEHLKIYKGAILGTLERALGNIYPVCERLLGQAFFAGMARQFAYETPSSSPDLANFGDGFYAFIAGFEPAAALTYLPDIAKLEWHWHRAFNAGDETALDTVALAGVPESETGRIVFRLPVSAVLMASEFPIQRIWQVNQPDWKDSQVVDLDQGGCRLIVWRQDYDVRIDELDESGWRLLNGIADAATFNALAEYADAPDIDVLLPHCVRQGWVAGFELGAAVD